MVNRKTLERSRLRLTPPHQLRSTDISDHGGCGSDFDDFYYGGRDGVITMAVTAVTTTGGSMTVMTSTSG